MEAGYVELVSTVPIHRYFSVSAMSLSMIPQVSAILLRVKPLGEGHLFLASMASSQNTIKDIVV